MASRIKNDRSSRDERSCLPRCHPHSAMPHSRDRRPGSGRRPGPWRSALPCIAGALRRSLLERSRVAAACRSVRRLPGPFAAAVAPVSTSHRVSLPTLDGYSSRSSARIRDVGGVCGGRSGASSAPVADGRSRMTVCRHPGPPEAAPRILARTRRSRKTGSVGYGEPRIRRRALAEAERRTAAGLDDVANGGTCPHRPGGGRRHRGGEGGIRTHEVFRLCAFQERRHQPLGHLSAAQR